MGSRRPKPPSPARAASLAAQVADDIRKAHKDPLAALTLENGGRAVVTDVCPTGSMVLDHHILGVGGLPWGRSYEMAGPEGSGKTTIACKIMANAQRDGALPVLSDKENKFAANWAAIHGLDLGGCVEYPAPYIEAYIDEMLRLMSKYGKRTKLLFVLDSAANLLPKKYVQGDLEDKEVPGAMARQWSRGFPKLSGELLRTQSTLLVLNQLRDKIGAMFGPTEETPAGRAMKFNCTVRLRVSGGEEITEGKAKVGRYMGIRAIKNGLYRGGQGKAVLKMRWDTGFDDHWSVVNHAKEVGCIENDASVKQYREALTNLGWAEYDPEPKEEETKG